MKCPRCQSIITSLPDPDSIVTCPGCGSRLMTRSAAIRSQGGAKPLAGAQPSPLAAAPPSAVHLPPSATLPPTPAMMLGITRPAPTPAPAGGAEKPAAKAGAAQAPEPAEKGRPAKGKGPKAEARGEPPAQDRVAGALLETLDLLLAEIRVVRKLQEDILGSLRGAAPSASAEAAEEGPALTPIRVRRRKTVVLIDDDPKTREAAVAELHHADVPVRACPDGNAAIAAIAEEKPDVIVLEHTLAGEMEGRDVVNMIKATIEWVDIPIILWTREDAASHKDARQLHGADEVVLKSAGAQALVARVITVFRRG
jgi:CheY-like chemotaxis protein